MVINRRNFIGRSASLLAGYLALPEISLQVPGQVMTVSGWMEPGKMGFTLTHEHILVDFIGADKISPSRYDPEQVYQVALPHLVSAREKGCQTLVDCTPAWLGRDTKLLQRLSVASGLNILTNTGYYAAASEKYLPAHAYTETAQQIADRWIREWEKGIADSGIKPGFIKSGVDKYPFSAV